MENLMMYIHSFLSLAHTHIHTHKHTHVCTQTQNMTEIIIAVFVAITAAGAAALLQSGMQERTNSQKKMHKTDNI